jgi:2'-5' RNA ligase
VIQSAARPLRLFVAASVPRTHLDALASAVGGLHDRLPGARWAPVENQHVTLKFLGSTPADALPDVLAALESSAASHRPSDVALGGLGAFPSARRARVLWARVDDPSSLLTSLAGALDANLAPLGYRIEKRPFTPHLTLARFREPARVDGIVSGFDWNPPEPWTVQTIELYLSRLSPRGATYEPVTSVALSR